MDISCLLSLLLFHHQRKCGCLHMHAHGAAAKDISRVKASAADASTAMTNTAVFASLPPTVAISITTQCRTSTPSLEGVMAS